MSFEEKVRRAELVRKQAHARELALKREQRRREKTLERKEAEKRKNAETRRLILKGRIYEEWEEADPRFAQRMATAAKAFCLADFDRAVFGLAPLPEAERRESALAREQKRREALEPASREALAGPQTPTPLSSSLKSREGEGGERARPTSPPPPPQPATPAAMPSSPPGRLATDTDSAVDS